MTPFKGCRFYHNRVLASDYSGKPQLFKVTRVAQGVVYYRADYGLHEDGSEWLGAPSYCTLEQFPSIMLRGPISVVMGN